MTENPPSELERLAALLKPIFAGHGVQRAIVFGSLARGEATRHSDVDLIVVKDTEKRLLERYYGILAEIVQAVRGRDVDLLIYTPRELAAMSARPFIAKALREGKVIYESEREQASG